MPTTIKMKAPSGVGFGYLPDGTKLTADSQGYVDCPYAYVSVLQTAGFTIEAGEFSSSTVGSGVALSSSKKFAKRIAADDGGVALTAGAYKANEMRMLLATALASGDISIFGNEDHLKVVADASLSTGHLAGGWGYLEMSTTGKISYGGGYYGMLDCPSGAQVTALAGAFFAGSNDLRGTHGDTAPIAGLAVQNPVAGTFDALIALGSATGCHGNGSSKTTMGTVAKWLIINIAGVKYYTPAYADTST